MRVWPACKDSGKIQVNFQRHWKIDKLEKCDRDTSRSDFRPNLRKKTFHNLVILEKTDICSGFLTSQLTQKIVQKITHNKRTYILYTHLMMLFYVCPCLGMDVAEAGGRFKIDKFEKCKLFSDRRFKICQKSFAHYHPVMLLRDILRKTNEWKDKETTVKQQCRSRSESLLESRVTCVRWNPWNLIRIFEISSESSESH